MTALSETKKYQAYPEYKDSGVEWVGNLPVAWDLSKLKHMFSIINGSTPKSGISTYWDGNITWVTPADLSKLPNFQIGASVRTITEDGLNSCGTTIVPSGSLVLSSRAPIGSLAVTSVPLCTNQGCKSLVVRESVCVKYVYYYLSVMKEQLNLFGRGTTFLELSTDDLGNFPIPLLAQAESENIANFLDHETAKIDTLIEKQQQLIKLLKEKRQAVISHAVTKGLNPQAPMKDSGVEWLGEVPEHWVISPLKLYISTRKGVAFKSADFCDSGIKVVKASDIKQKTIREPNIFLPTNFVNDFPNAVLNAGDIVLSTVGSAPEVKNSAVGQIGMVPNHLAGSLLNQNTVIFTPRNNLLSQNFLFYLIQTGMYRDHLDLHAHGTANQASLNVADMLNFMFAMPSYKEQLDIVSYIEISNLHFDKLENQCSNAITLLAERRTALISAAVTGKIDVRNWQAPISEYQAMEQTA
ncbi:type I restriction modification DNA specificity domain protein [Vibrio parahaemolyticus VPTS-2010_2]|uniref:restriction endonuclease subunit S n=2 Tax=Vibrio parahaemolyticus TaxID=670 RepID=UPI0004474FFC|nr:restriction endonuclease subunit S [Vibrio parahaemolyticus]EXJ46047.1 type I restriction modification DNA specificity domain protein [Vibrio parahaemolyticus VPTS-2010_2]